MGPLLSPLPAGWARSLEALLGLSLLSLHLSAATAEPKVTFQGLETISLH